MSEESEPRKEDEEAQGAQEPSLNARALGIKVLIGGLLFAILVIGLGATFWEPLHELSRQFVTYFGGPGIFIGFFIADAFSMPVPVDALNTFGLLGGMSFLEVVVWGASGSLIGGVVGYFVGGWIRRFAWFQRFYGKRAAEMDRLVARYGAQALALTALTPLPFSFGCWACGALKMRFSLFLAVSLLRIPRVAGYLTLIYFGLLSVTP